MSKTKFDINTALPAIIMAGAVVALYILYKGGQKVGAAIKETAGSTLDAITPGSKSEGIDERVKALQDDPENNPFNGKYMNERLGRSGMLYVPGANKLKYVQQLYKKYHPDFVNKNLIPATHDLIMSIIKGLKQKNQLSDIAYLYEQKYNADLLADIQTSLKNAGVTNLEYSKFMPEILDAVNKLK